MPVAAVDANESLDVSKPAKKQKLKLPKPIFAIHIDGEPIYDKKFAYGFSAVFLLIVFINVII